ncbi:MAG: PAS domain S-box protein [Treponema sp.]|nr:PAS domain S-box protein [Treponema sp.]
MSTTSTSTEPSATDPVPSRRSPPGPENYRSTLVRFAVLIAIVLGAAGFLFGHAEYMRVRKARYKDLAAIGALKAAQIEAWRADFRDDCILASRSPLLLAGLEGLRARPSDRRLLASLEERMSLQVEYGSCEDAALYGTDGTLIAAAANGKLGDPPRLGEHAMRTAREALALGGPRFRDLHRHRDGRYSIDAVAPVLDERSRPIALLVVKRDPAVELFPILRHWPVPSASDETLLVRREGDRALVLNSTRFDPLPPLGLSFPLSRTENPAVQAVLGRRGFFVGTDYRGVEVIADLEPIPLSPWFLEAKVDQAEALNEARFRAGAIFGISLFIFLAATAGLGFVLGRKRSGLYRALYHEERRRAELHSEFSATLFGIGDGVISTDERGRVRWLNAVAERLTGWSEAEARGRELAEVFSIRSEETGLEALNPVEKVMRTGMVVGLANHTVLEARDGTTRPIADSGSPIRGEDGSIQGVVLVFRDMSAEREARARETWLSALVERSLNEIYVFDASSLRFGYANRAALANLGYEAEELYALTPVDIKPEFTAERFDELLEPLRSGRQSLVTLATVHRRKDGSTYDIYLAIQLLESREGLRFVAMGLDFSERKKLEADLKLSLAERETLLRELHHRTKNNLQVVCSLLALEASELSDDRAREALGDMERRVGSMSLAHELLYRSESLARIELGPFLESIVKLALESRDLSGRVEVAVEAASVEVAIDTASPLGLVVNELATNSAKHAFPQGRRGSVRLRVGCGEGSIVELEYRDDGIGLSDGFDPGDAHLGLTLVRSLVEGQLRGSLDILGSPGFSCRIRFEMPVCADPGIW